MTCLNVEWLAREDPGLTRRANPCRRGLQIPPFNPTFPPTFPPIFPPTFEPVFPPIRNPSSFEISSLTAFEVFAFPLMTFLRICLINSLAAFRLYFSVQRIKLCNSSGNPILKVLIAGQPRSLYLPYLTGATFKGVQFEYLINYRFFDQSSSARLEFGRRADQAALSDMNSQKP
jgi:hypothetical protein